VRIKVMQYSIDIRYGKFFKNTQRGSNTEKRPSIEKQSNSAVIQVKCPNLWERQLKWRGGATDETPTNRWRGETADETGQPTNRGS